MYSVNVYILPGVILFAGMGQGSEKMDMRENEELRRIAEEGY